MSDATIGGGGLVNEANAVHGRACLDMLVRRQESLFSVKEKRVDDAQAFVVGWCMEWEFVVGLRVSASSRDATRHKDRSDREV